MKLKIKRGKGKKEKRGMFAAAVDAYTVTVELMFTDEEKNIMELNGLHGYSLGTYMYEFSKGTEVEGTATVDKILKEGSHTFYHETPIGLELRVQDIKDECKKLKHAIEVGDDAIKKGEEEELIEY